MLPKTIRKALAEPRARSQPPLEARATLGHGRPDDGLPAARAAHRRARGGGVRRPRDRVAAPQDGRRALDLRARSSSARGGWPARCSELGIGPGDRVATFGVELAAPPRALPRRAEHGRGAAHAEHPPVRGGPALHRRPRRGPRDLPRRVAGRGDAELRGRRARGPDARRRRASATARSTTRSSSAGGDPGFAFPDLDENSGRGHVLHERHDRAAQGRRLLAPLDGPALAVRQPGRRGRPAARRDSIMPVVPMFHANAWGLPYAAALAGARQVFPGPKHDPGRPGRARSPPSASPAPPACRRSGRACSSSSPPPDLSSLRRDHGRRLGRARER